MKIYEEKNLCDFNFWSGAIYHANKMTSEQLTEVESVLEELYPEGMEATQINDLFWFDFETVCEWIGFNPDEEEEEE